MPKQFDLEEYGYYKKTKKERVHRSWWSVLIGIIDILFFAVLILCSVLLICAYLAKYINPAATSFFSFMGLMFPVLFVIEIACGLYWAMRWKWYTFIALGVLVAGSVDARYFYQIDLKEHYSDHKPSKSELVLMSYNVMKYSYPYTAEDGKKPMELICRFVRANNAAIWCVQETESSDRLSETVETILPDMKYNCFYPYHNNDNQKNPAGLAIYSRYPIIAHGAVDSADPNMLHSIWADIRIKRDTVRIVNNHLQSTYVNNNDVDYLSSFRISETRSRAQLKEIVSKLGGNYKKRAPQADAIAKFIARSPYPVIVCGDFNDTPLSYAYNSMSSGLTDAFVEQGKGTAGTYNGFFNMFRIDYILMSEDLEIRSYYPFDVVYSDHNPIAASFDFVK